jgi:hypothetical protein
LQRVAEDAREDALKRAGAKVAEVAQDIAPVGRTGHLRRSIERGMPLHDATEIWVVAGAYYSIFVERGTGIYAQGFPGAREARSTSWVYRDANGRYYTTEGHRQQPFMNPAIDIAAAEGI